MQRSEIRESAGVICIPGFHFIASGLRLLMTQTKGQITRCDPVLVRALRVLAVHEPPGADPHAGWCGEGGLEARPYPIRRHGQ